MITVFTHILCIEYLNAYNTEIYFIDIYLDELYKSLVNFKLYLQSVIHVPITFQYDFI